MVEVKELKEFLDSKLKEISDELNEIKNDSAKREELENYKKQLETLKKELEGVKIRTIGNYALTKAVSDNIDIMKKALDTGSASSLISGSVATQLFIALSKYGVYRKYALNLPIKSSKDTIPTVTANIQAVWFDEGQTMSESTPTIVNANKVLSKLGCLVPLTNELIEDEEIDLIAALLELGMIAVAKEEDRVGFLGSVAGGDKFDGLISNANIPTIVAASNLYDSVTLKQILEMPGLVRAGALNNAAYFMHPSIFYKLVPQEYRQHYYNGTDASNSDVVGHFIPGRALEGYPVIFVEALPAYTTAAADGKPVAFFGDLKMAAYIGFRKDLQLDASKDYKFGDDVTVIKLKERINIGQIDINAMAVYKLA